MMSIRQEKYHVGVREYLRDNVAAGLHYKELL